MKKRIIEYNNILLSILIASNRDESVVQDCIRTLFQSASNPERIEVLIRIDYEANRSKVWIRNILMTDGGVYRKNIRILEGPQNYGYCDGTVCSAEMAKVAKGEFLMVWNDDIFNLTQNYDDYLLPHVGKIVLLKGVAPSGTHDWDFPIIHRLVYDITETMSIFCYGNYHWDMFDRYAPELVRNINITCKHTPTADFGSSSGLGINCLGIEDPEYKLNKEDYFENQEGTKEEHFAKHYIGKLKQYIKENPHYQLEKKNENTN